MRLFKKEFKIHCPNYLKKLWELIGLNFGTLVKFELIFKLATLVVFGPLAVWAVRIAMKITGYSYITLENVFNFALHPLVIVMALIALVIFTFITVFDIGALLVIFDESYHGDRISLVSLVKNNFIQCAKLFRVRNIGVSFITLFLAPFLNVGFGSSVLSSFRLPEFITDYIFANRWLVLLVVAIYLFSMFVFSNWLYVIHYMVLEKKSFKQARVASYRLTKNHRLGDLLRVFIAEFVFVISLQIVIYLGSIGLRALIRALSGRIIIESIAVSFASLILSVLSLFYVIFSNVANYAVLSVLFYRHKTERGEEIKEVVLGPAMRKKDLRHLRYWIAGFSAVTFIGFFGWIYLSETGKLHFNVELLRDMEISAHRGASVDYPENTMSAFQGAVDAGADWIELDVQQTKDGMIVVAHDANLKRVAGVRKNIYDMNYDELEDIDVGSYLNSDFAPERIPTLAEVLIFASENSMKLNIELKPNEHDFEVEESVIGLINRYYRKDMCMISSLQYSSLERVKQIDPEMRTLYTLSLASGNIESIEYADAVSVEASSITSRMVRRVHNAGKEIFAWTVNSEDAIYDMIDLGVDNIITDEVVEARSLVLKYRSGAYIDRFWRLTMELAGA